MNKDESPKPEPLPSAILLQIEMHLRDCVGEIRRLRRDNEIMGAQLAVVETFQRALLGPRPERGMSPDVVWRVEELLKILDTTPETPAQDRDLFEGWGHRLGLDGWYEIVPFQNH